MGKSRCSAPGTGAGSRTARPGRCRAWPPPGPPDRPPAQDATPTRTTAPCPHPPDTCDDARGTRIEHLERGTAFIPRHRLGRHAARDRVARVELQPEDRSGSVELIVGHALEDVAHGEEQVLDGLPHQYPAPYAGGL